MTFIDFIWITQIQGIHRCTATEECQARSEKKLDFHFNMAFSKVSLAKVLLWMKLPDHQKSAFSMRNIKMARYNIDIEPTEFF
ncbi:hypothetical protein BW716_10755 [[Flexibacter] sp. ATCC 35208]|nr:hypothetical protein BW716_10755 [[Flexibacter] sp. ATCC 35208]